jgi:superfamily I DNA/RNA helicase
LSEGREPDRIGYFSFTRKATQEAIDRACAKFKLPRKELKWFRTLHSLAYQWMGCTNTDIIQKQDFKDFYREYGIDISQSIKAEENVVGEEESGLHLIDLYRVKNTSLEEEFRKFGHVKGGLARLQKIDKNYRLFKKNRTIKDYTDLITEFNKIQMSPKLDIVIVDEVQDLKPNEWQMVQIMMKQAKAIYLAGDDDQAIYSWSGADVSKLIDLDCHLQVLNQSYRIPKTIYLKSNTLVSRIKKRISKDWQPRSDKGQVKNTNFESIDLRKGQWLILGRTNYYINNIAEELKNKGFLFEKNNYLSIASDVVVAYRGWIALQKAQQLSYQSVKTMYQYISLGSEGVSRGKKGLPGADQQGNFSYETLSKEWGLNISLSTPWEVALSRIKEYDRIYIKQILNSGHDLDEKVNIKLSTIHGAKGGESQNVVVFSDISKRINDNMWANRDDERRVFYVAMTRAKQNLYIVPSTSPYEYEEILR